MTKKDFITVSSVIRELRDKSVHKTEDGLLMLDSVCYALAHTFAQINPRFDFSKFYEACGIKN